MIINSFNKSRPLKVLTESIAKQQQPPWWSKNLSELREKTRQSFSKWQRTHEDKHHEEYKTCLRTFKKEQRKVVRSLQTIENTSKNDRLPLNIPRLEDDVLPNQKLDECSESDEITSEDTDFSESSSEITVNNEAGFFR